MPEAGLFTVIHDVEVAAVHEQPDVVVTAIELLPPAAAIEADAGLSEYEQVVGVGEGVGVGVGVGSVGVAALKNLISLMLFGPPRNKEACLVDKLEVSNAPVDEVIEVTIKPGKGDSDTAICEPALKTRDPGLVGELNGP